MWHFRSIKGYYKVDFGPLGKNSVAHFVSKFYRIRVKKTRFRSKMDSIIWGRHLKSGFFFFWISSKTPAVDDDSCWSNNRNAPLMSTFLSFVLDLSNLWLHHLMASAVAVPISPEAAWCVCVWSTQTKPPIKLRLYLTICRIYTRDLWVTPSVGKVFHFLSHRLKKKEDRAKLWASHVGWSSIPKQLLPPGIGGKGVF